VRIGVNLYQSQ